jgi:hypothetical protein
VVPHIAQGEFIMQSKKLWSALVASALGAGLLLSAAPAFAADNGALTCQMTFTLSGWSAAYATASGTGTVTCSNGQSLRVTLDAKGGGLTVGKYKIDNGHGDFTGVNNIRDVLGGYAMAQAHAGAVNSSHVAALTKGSVSLALSGTGNGWDIGVGFSGFTIKAAK